jgi:hypothetical protein
LRYGLSGEPTGTSHRPRSSACAARINAGLLQRYLSIVSRLLREKKFFELCNCIDIFLPWLSHGQHLLCASLFDAMPGAYRRPGQWKRMAFFIRRVSAQEPPLAIPIPFSVSSFSNSDKKARFKPGFHSIPANPRER